MTYETSVNRGNIQKLYCVPETTTPLTVTIEGLNFEITSKYIIGPLPNETPGRTALRSISEAIPSGWFTVHFVTEFRLVGISSMLNSRRQSVISNQRFL